MDAFISSIIEKLNLQQTSINKLLTRKTPTHNLITEGAVSGNVLTFDGYNWVASASSSSSAVPANTTNAIAANAADIATNTANIATNTADIATNTADIANIANNINQVEGNLNVNGNLTGNNLNIDNITQTAGSIISSQGTTLEFTLNGQTSGGQGMFFIHAPSLKGLMPNTSQGNGVFSFGSSSRRWGQIYSNYSTISTSDDRMKINERPVTNALNFLENLNFYEYEKVGTLNGTDVTETERGVLAQDILNTDLSYCVFGGGIDEETGDEIPYGLRYNDLIMTACQALKDQTTIIKNLEKRIATLESQ